MRKIIDGRTYNTETSKEIGVWSNGCSRRDFGFCREALYKNTKGAYFIYGEGGPMSKYSKSAGQNSWTGGEDITPLSVEEARKWAEEHLEPEEYEAEFGQPEEAEPTTDLVNRERVNLTLGNDTIALLRRYSAETGVPMARMVDRAIVKMYGGQEAE